MNTSKTTARDMERSRACFQPFVRSPLSLPVRFRLDSRAYQGIPKEFLPQMTERYIDSNMIERIFTARDPNSGLVLRAECLEYLDFPVVEWTLWFENQGQCNSPVISDLWAMDAALPGLHPAITHNNGDTTTYELYTDSVVDLDQAGVFCQQPEGGHASECAWPYYRVLCDGFGYNLAIGWPGQWQARFEAGLDSFRFQARQQYTHFYLKPGEKVRTPRMALMCFEGGAERGINLWRRWMNAHVVPKPNGQLQEPFFALSDEENNVVFFTQTHEQRELNTLENLKSNGIVPDVYWLDAGWYPCENPDGSTLWVNTGNLHADEKRFPRGLRPVSDKCREYGAKFLLWFEPERIKLSHQSDEYPDEFVLKLKDTSVIDSMRLTGIDPCHVVETGLMNLADPRCRDWLTDHLDKLIKDFGVDIYRQDFNFPPLHWWLQHDEGPDRQGITENLYNQGYLHMWDQLLLRNPGLLINSVSSGGRRSDLETLRRSVSLHQSDYGFGQHPVHQAILACSFAWQPFCGTQARNHDTEDGEYDYERPYERPEALQNFDNFAAHNGLCPAMYMNRLGMRSLSFPNGEFQKTEEGKYYKFFRSMWEKAVPYIQTGDFYILQMTDRTNTCWHAIQFHDEDKDAGILQAIRNTKAAQEAVTLFPRGIRADRTYVFQSPEFGRSCTFSGQSLLEDGFSVALPRRTGELWFYWSKSELSPKNN